MRIVLNLFVLILLFSTSCKSDKKESNFKTEPRMHDSIYYKNLKTINVDIRNIETIKLSNLYDSIRLVSLETNPDIVMGEIVKLEIHDNNLYFQTPKSLFIYNNKGEFLNKISNSGKGPGEYLSLSDFYIDKDEKVIEIYDNKKKQIIKYSFSGDFLEKIDVHLDGYSFTKLNENKYAIYIGSGYYNQESNSRLNILDGKGNIEKRTLASESHTFKKPSESFIFVFTTKHYKYGTLQAQQK